MKILTKDREHIFIVYKYNNKIRLFLNIFGMIPAVIETIESTSFFIQDHYLTRKLHTLLTQRKRNIKKSSLMI